MELKRPTNIGDLDQRIIGLLDYHDGKQEIMKILNQASHGSDNCHPDEGRTKFKIMGICLVDTIPLPLPS